MLRLHEISKTRQHSSRAGFSLVELLVSITIFVILATLSISAFRDSKHDKVAAGARQVSATFGGARSRAAREIEPRGIRLVRDRADYRIITGLQYIGESELFDGYLRIQINAAGVAQLRCVEVGGVTVRDWEGLTNEGLLRPGSKIYLRNYNPASLTANAENSSSGRWYTIASAGFAPSGEDRDNDGSLDPGEDLNGSGALENEQRLQIVGPIDGATWSDGTVVSPLTPNTWQSFPASAPPGFYSGLSDTIPLPYLLRLSPQELPETEMTNLPPGVAVDLLSSRIPQTWYINEDFDEDTVLDAGEDINGNGILDYVIEDLNQNGVLDGGEDLTGNGILDEVHLDITVSPNGTVGGAISGTGPIYLYLCPREDIERMQAMRSTSNGGLYGVNYRAGLIPGDFENNYGPDHPSSERKVICIIPQTGLVYIADVNGVDTDAPGTAGYGYADDPFSLARAGREGR